MLDVNAVRDQIWSTQERFWRLTRNHSHRTNRAECGSAYGIEALQESASREHAIRAWCLVPSSIISGCCRIAAALTVTNVRPASSTGTAIDIKAAAGVHSTTIPSQCGERDSCGVTTSTGLFGDGQPAARVLVSCPRPVTASNVRPSSPYASPGPVLRSRQSCQIRRCQFSHACYSDRCTGTTVYSMPLYSAPTKDGRDAQKRRPS